MSELQLRAWQAAFIGKLLASDADDFLLIAAPAAGKTIAAGAAAARVMEARDAQQLVVVCPTVVVRDQWIEELATLGFRMTADWDGEVWPEWVHGVCATYAQVSRRAGLYATALRRRPTVAVFDEIHHAGEDLAWGRALRDAFAGALLRLSLSGTPFRSDRDHIPFVRYDQLGKCIPDFAYDYGRAVREGVCRAIRFHAHDGAIAWEEHGRVRSANFTDKLAEQSVSKRLRASLDPRQPYLRRLLEAADEDLERIRSRIPDAAGLVVCDSQAHAAAIDPILSEVADELPVLAMSDVPRSHEAIRAFTHSADRWLVSVRMVSEGVDIPRLGVIVWATAASTEMMVRQVAGRALRGRGRYAKLVAVMHMPADPRLVHHAGKLDVLAGVSGKVRQRHGAHGPRLYGQPTYKARSIDPAPFLEWFERMEKAYGTDQVCRMCGWPPNTGARTIHRWRREGAFGHALTIFDACHMAGVSFDVLYGAPEFAEARAYVNDPGLDVSKLHFGTVEAIPGESMTVMPDVPARRAPAADEPMVLKTPELPPSPVDLEAERVHLQTTKGEVLQLLTTYTALRRTVDPSFGLPRAHAELMADVGRFGSEASVEQVSEATAWLRDRLADFARRHPDKVKELAQLRRRMAVAS